MASVAEIQLHVFQPSTMVIPNKKYVCSIVLRLHEGWDGQLDGRMRRSSAQPLGLACRGGWMGWTAGWKDEMIFQITAWGG